MDSPAKLELPRILSPRSSSCRSSGRSTGSSLSHGLSSGGSSNASKHSSSHHHTHNTHHQQHQQHQQPSILHKSPEKGVLKTSSNHPSQKCKPLHKSEGVCECVCTCASQHPAHPPGGGVSGRRTPH